MATNRSAELILSASSLEALPRRSWQQPFSVNSPPRLMSSDENIPRAARRMVEALRSTARQERMVCRKESTEPESCSVCSERTALISFISPILWDMAPTSEAV